MNESQKETMHVILSGMLMNGYIQGKLEIPVDIAVLEMAMQAVEEVFKRNQNSKHGS